MKIITDDYESAFTGTEHLIAKGCRSIAYLGILKTHSISKNRLHGYQDAMKKNNIAIDKQHIVSCSGDIDQDYQVIKALLTSAHRPTGIFAAVEHAALVCYEVAADLGLKIPQDFKIISFSNLRTASLLNPPLSTITQPAYHIGQEAAKALFGELKNRNGIENTKITLRSSLIERESTA